RWPRKPFVAVGKPMIGPKPQVMPEEVGSLGDRKKLGALSASPVSRETCWTFREGTTIEANRLIRSVWKDPWDIREGNGCPGYQIPVFVEMKWNHRLGDQRVAKALATLATTVVKIVLERNTDQIGNRVGELLGNVLILTQVRIDIRSRAGWS